MAQKKYNTEEERIAARKARNKAKREERKKMKTEALIVGYKSFEVNPSYRICSDRLNIWIQKLAEDGKWRRVTGYYQDYYLAFRDLADKRWKSINGIELGKALKAFREIAEETNEMLKETLEEYGVRQK